jgi:hypothetical protein
MPLAVEHRGGNEQKFCESTIHAQQSARQAICDERPGTLVATQLLVAELGQEQQRCRLIGTKTAKTAEGAWPRSWQWTAAKP